MDKNSLAPSESTGSGLSFLFGIWGLFATAPKGEPFVSGSVWQYILILPQAEVLHPNSRGCLM